MLNITLSVFINWDLKEGQKTKARIIADATGSALNSPKPSAIKTKDNQGSYFKCKKSGHWAHDYT